VRLAVPDLDAATALARTWAEGVSPVDTWETASLYAAERLLRSGRADLAFLPTLAVLRHPDDFSVVPGVGLVGSVVGPVQLDVRSGLDTFERVGFDPHFPQEVLLAQVLLKELYQAQPQFVPIQPGAPVPKDLDARLRVDEAAEPGSDVLTLDLAREWFELTTRPFVWALLAAPVGTVTPAEAKLLRDEALLDSPPPDLGAEPTIGGVTLAAYAHAGLEEWTHYLFYHRALDALPEIPFVELPDDEE
jgi:hypothetical protein